LEIHAFTLLFFICVGVIHNYCRSVPGFNEPTDVGTNDKHVVRPTKTWVTRLPTGSSLETTSVSYVSHVNAISLSMQEPSNRGGRVTRLLAPGIVSEGDATLMVNNPPQSSACPIELQQLDRTQRVNSRRFQSRDRDFIRSTSSCSQLQQQRARVQRKLMSSLSDQRQQPLLAVNSQPNLQHTKRMKTHAVPESAAIASRPISDRDRRQYCSTKSCVASARDLESVMNYMSLSIPLSLNDVSRRPSVVFGDRNYPDMLDRLSQIEAEMDECLTPDAMNGNARVIAGSTARSSSPTVFECTASVKIIMSSVSENRLTSSLTSAEFDDRNYRQHSCNDLSRRPTQHCTNGNLFQISGDLIASSTPQNDVVSTVTSRWTNFSGHDGCSDCCCDDDAPECDVKLIDNRTVIKTDNDYVVQVDMDHQPHESYSTPAQRRSSVSRSCEYETPVNEIVPSCAKRKSSVALMLQRTRSSQSLGPWATVPVDGSCARASTEYEVSMFAPPVVNILSPTSSPDDDRRRCYKRSNMKSPNRRVSNDGFGSANSPTGDIARHRPDESLFGVVQREVMSTSRQCKASSVTSEQYEHDTRLLVSSKATGSSPSLAVNCHHGNTLTICTAVSPRCDSLAVVRGTKAIWSSTGSRRRQRFKTAKRRKHAVTSRLRSWCCLNHEPWLRSELITLRRVPTADSSCNDANMSKRASRNERKATKVLGIILMAFVLFWTPFFAVNLVTAVYPSLIDDWLTDDIAASVVWWGYTASLANPVIYTLFSKAFRTAFCRVLTCQPGRRGSLRGRGRPNRQPRQQCGSLTPLRGDSRNQLHSSCRSRLNSGATASERPSSIIVAQR